MTHHSSEFTSDAVPCAATWPIAAIFLTLALAFASTGCALFAPPEPDEPRTVQEWIGQERIQ